MFNFLKFFVIILFFLKIIPHEIESDLSYFNNNQSFFPIFIISSYFNFIINKHQKTNINLDLLFKYLLLIFKTPNFLINYLLNITKKIYLYLVHFKYKHDYNSVKIFFKKYSFLTFI